jgi:hypothetical protein
MRRLAFNALLRLTSALVILNQETASTSPWVLNDEQREVLRALCDHQRVIILKGRQVGISTVCCFFDLAFALAHAGVNVAIVADTEDKSVGLLSKIRNWCTALGIPLSVDNTTSITLANGSTIDALSAVSSADEGESRVGRSKTYLLLHMSEMGFWRNDAAVFRALTSGATSPHVRMVIESTASAADNLFKTMWSNDANGWHHIWLSIEKHAVYRADASSIDETTWARLQKLGFTRRDTAAWWHAKLVSDFAGDERGCAREFPIKPEDCFAFAEGRWIFTWREATVRHAGTWHEKDTVFRGWTYYPDDDETESHVVGVDVGAGLGLDSSAIAVVGRRSGALKATFVDNTISIPDFERVITEAAKTWRAKSVRIESNGLGQGPYQHLRDESNVPVVEQKTSLGEKHARLTRLRLAIEGGEWPIGREVMVEAMSSRIVKPKGPQGAPVYEGRDDLLNALSFAQKQLEEDRAEAPPAAPAPDIRDVFVPPRLMKKTRTA